MGRDRISQRRIRKSLLVACALAAIASCRPPSTFGAGPANEAPKAYPAALMKELGEIRDSALSDDYAFRQVAHLTDNIGPRPPGSPQAEAAAAYVAEELRKLGLDVALEDVMVPRWIRGQEAGELVEYPGRAPGTTQKISLTSLGGNKPTGPDGVTADVLVARDSDELASLGRERVAGKIVLFDARFNRSKAANGFALQAYKDAVTYRSQGAELAAGLGAVGVLVRSVGGGEARLPHAGGSHSAGIPACAVSGEDAGLIARLSSQGTVRMRLLLTSFTGEAVLSHNVVADLKGATDPDQVVVVSGHLDSWDLGTGAIDDAAGVGVAMEAVQLVQALHLHPRRTIRFIAWMDEENSGSGTEAYARARAKEFKGHVGAIECDSGASRPLGFRARVSKDALPFLAPAQAILKVIGADQILPEEDTGRDLAPLAKAGVPTLAVMQDMRTYFDYHHTAADTLDKVDPEGLRETSAAMAVLGYALADMPEALPR